MEKGREINKQIIVDWSFKRGGILINITNKLGTLGKCLL